MGLWGRCEVLVRFGGGGLRVHNTKVIHILLKKGYIDLDLNYKLQMSLYFAALPPGFMSCIICQRGSSEVENQLIQILVCVVSP